MIENTCTIFDNFSEFENLLPMGTEMTVVYISGYVTSHEDHSPEDTFMYYEKYGHYLSDMNHGSSKTPHDSVWEWVMYGYVMFHEVVVTYRKSLCKVLVNISECYNLKIEVACCYFCKHVVQKLPTFVFVKSTKEPKQKMLKLSLLH